MLQVNRLSLLGGTNLRTTVYRLLSELLGQAVASQLNWCGYRGKLGLSQFQLAAVIKGQWHVMRTYLVLFGVYSFTTVVNIYRYSFLLWQHIHVYVHSASTDAVRAANDGAYSEKSDDDIAHHVKNWLKNSGDRDGGRKRRARRAARKKAADAALASASATHFIAGVVADAMDDTNATDTDAGDDDDDQLQSQSLFGRFVWDN